MKSLDTTKTTQKESSRDKRIATFNKMADASLGACLKSTVNFTKKSRLGVSAPLLSLSPISLNNLEVSKTHHERVVYCRIASRVWHAVSIMVLVEDQAGDLADLAVYGNIDRDEFKEGRTIAIKEPFYKVRGDGTEGIRVDNPTDVVFDPPPEEELNSKEPASSTGPMKLATVEERLQEILCSSNCSIGVDKLYKQLVDEGYKIKKNRIRALKKAALSQEANKNSAPKKRIVPIISERWPKLHRVLQASSVLKNKDTGDKAFLSKSYLQAENLYSKALLHKNDPHNGSIDGVSLWQLYSDRSKTRIQLGMLTEALEDSLEANLCAPSNEVTPIIRCVEAMAALGMQEEANNLLSDSHEHFPNDSDLIKKMEKSILPPKILMVGKDSKFKTISEAIRRAPSGAEIQVCPGIYKEPLFFDKPLTLRCTNVDDYDAIRSLEDGYERNWAEIRVADQNALSFRFQNIGGAAVHIVGFKITCDAVPAHSFHAANVIAGNVVFRNCNISSSSGPVVVAQLKESNLIMQICAVHSGSQGGILAVDGARISLHETHCCYNAAAGLELRNDAFGYMEYCDFYNNGKQGVVSWKNAGELNAKKCEIHSHSFESGVLVSESLAVYDRCKLFGNNLCGVVCQDRGLLKMFNCEVHDNCEGVLIQGNGSAHVQRCDIRSNRANGIFVGFDHTGSASLTENEVYKNRSKGILIGNTKNVVAKHNCEYENLGLPPQLPTNIDPRSCVVSAKFLRRNARNKDFIKNALAQNKSKTFLDSVLSKQDAYEKVIEELGKDYKACAFCKIAPADTDPPLKTCSRCNETSYCSKLCQRADWFEHKKICMNKSVKYPSYLDNNKSV